MYLSFWWDSTGPFIWINLQTEDLSSDGVSEQEKKSQDTCVCVCVVLIVVGAVSSSWLAECHLLIKKGERERERGSEWSVRAAGFSWSSSSSASGVECFTLSAKWTSLPVALKQQQQQPHSLPVVRGRWNLLPCGAHN